MSLVFGSANDKSSITINSSSRTFAANAIRVAACSAFRGSRYE